MKVLYASDMDRTLIYSKRFLEEYPNREDKLCVEMNDGRDISYMNSLVYEELTKLKDEENITFVPVTTRSLDEYKRINLGFVPKYAIVANGGIILENGVPMQEWEEYTQDNIDMMKILDISMFIENHCQSVISYKPKLIDNKYLFWKTSDFELADDELNSMMCLYKDFEFVRQRNKCYAIPKAFSKQVALRWLWHKLEKPYIVASGDSELDLPMLTLANKAIIPAHGALITEGFVVDGFIVDGGIESPLVTINTVRELAKA